MTRQAGGGPGSGAIVMKLKGKGGNGYFRGSRVWDSVYAGNTTRDLRHFTFQWSSSGNVAIANSFDSDLNLHGGFERKRFGLRRAVYGMP